MGPEGLLEALRASVRDIVRGESAVAVAYSGGLDSSVVAALAAEVTDTKCYAAFVPGSHDARTVVASAREDGRALEAISLSDDDLRHLARKAAALVGHDAPMAVAYTIPLISVVDRSREKLVLAGSGADELFGGYAKYVTSSNPARQMDIDLEKALEETSALTGYSAGLGKALGLPFLSREVRCYAASVPLGEKIRGTSRKVALREAAKELGLKSHERPKKAAQYSSGVMRRLEKIAAAEGVSVGDWVKSL